MKSEFIIQLLNLTKVEHAIVKLLEEDPMHIHDIVSGSNIDLTTALTLLLKLELKGAKLQLIGKQFARA